MLKASPVTRCLTQAIAFAMSLVSTGCCRTHYPSLPSRPTETSGWNHKAIETSLTIGSFVLAKGESTESDKLGVTLVDLEPSRLCAGPLSEPSPARLLLRFYDPSNRQVLCATTILIPNGATVGGGSLDCGDNAPPSFHIRAYNAKDKWVWLELNTTVGDTRW